jgi:hypothetical protein
MALKLSYCQLIKIVLSQIGGSPLQQVYTQLSQNLQQITKGSLIPTELAQLKTFIDQVTTALNAITGDINAMQRLTQQFFYNPVGTVSTELNTQVDNRLAQISEDIGAGPVPTAGNEAEYAALTDLKTKVTAFKTHTDTLSGVTEPSTTGGFGGCTLADLLGSGCSPAADVPDVDLQVIVDGFKSGAIITALKTNVMSVIANQTGYAQISTAITNLNNSLTTFNDTVTNKLNKIIIKRAVETYITDLAFKLLSGCSSGLVNATIRPEAKEAMTPFVEYNQKILSGELNSDGTLPGSNDITLAT